MSSSRTVQLASGLTISKVITGLWQIADMECTHQLDPVTTAKWMEPYAHAGIHTFDMADHYGSSEIIAGHFRNIHPNSVYLTKWVPPPGPVTRQGTEAAVHRALERMQAEQIDLMQFHTWNYADASWLDALFYLQELKQAGLIRHLGLTNFDSAHVNMAARSGIHIVSNQVCFSLLDLRAAAKMTEVCKNHNIKLLAFGTLAGGFLSDRWLGKPEPKGLKTWSQMKYKRYIDQAGGWAAFQSILKTLDEVAKGKNVSISNIATKYILEQPEVAGVIIGARLGESEHIEENKRLFDFELDEKSLKQIHKAASHLSPISGDCGDEYRKPPYLTASGDLSDHFHTTPAPYPVMKGKDGRSKVLSGTTWEDLAGFSRAVKKGNRILISGTTSTHRDKLIGGNDPAAQTHFVIDKIEGALQSLGARLDEIVRTRIFVRNINDWEPVARAHGERFKDIQPANTLVRADLVGKEYLIEMEAEALVSEE
jgi:aryl-alcohol dehydrogenase-like predicted oxidoreductase/enamine deaminase RidA (YjgF/YER057c/UK114 family)